MGFKKEYKVLEEIAVEPKTSKKIKILEKNKDLLQYIVYYALNFNKKYHIKKFPPKNFSFSDKSKKSDIFKYLDKLANSKGTSKENIMELASLCSCEEDISVVKRIVNCDLRCGINLKTALKVYPELPRKDIMLCGKAARVIIRKGKSEKISPELDEFVELCGGWKNVGCSEKENGVRALIYTSSDSPVYMSRGGLQYNNFSKFDEAILELKHIVATFLHKKRADDLIFDGDVVAKDEDFQKQMTQIRRLKDIDSSMFELRIFDIASFPEMTQKERENLLRSAYENLSKQHKKLIKVTLCCGLNDKASFLRLYTEITTNKKKEGVVLKNMNSLYEWKRSNNWCKVKTFFSEDLVVVRAEKGKEGKKFENTLGRLVVLFNGKEVGVGSGYNEKNGERDKLLANPPKVIEVEYKEITKDGSLYIPTYVRSRWEKE